MKQIQTVIACLFFISECVAQNVGIGTATPNTHAALEIQSSNKGLLIPRTSKASRTAMVNPPKGLMLYDTSYSAFYSYDGGRWRQVGDKNYDSATTDYSSTAVAFVNMPVANDPSVGIDADPNADAGFIYDDGGPSANYSANNYSQVAISNNNTVLGYRITVEQMNAEPGYDSLFIVLDYSNLPNDTLAKISGTQTGSYYINKATLKANLYAIRIFFRSNNINQSSGFRIRWGVIKANTALQDAAPAYGFHFDYEKKAAMGGVQLSNMWHTDSVGYYSFSYGFDARAKGRGSVAIGEGVSALGDGAVALGGGLANGAAAASLGGGLAIGDYSFTAGDGITRKRYSTATGNSTANGNYATATGMSTATGDYSTAFGNGNASGIESFAGGGATSRADIATAFGIGSANAFVSTALGSSYSNGNYSTATGQRNYANGYASFATGLYSDSILLRQTAVTSSTPLFIIGNGNSDADRSNALVVLKNGKVSIGDPSAANIGTKLQVTGTINDITLADNSGLMSIGYYSSTNMVIDQNDIQVRNSGAAANLNLQRLGGNLMIGSGTADQKLSVNGNASKAGGGSWATFSDSRLKQNITPYTDGLSSLLKINPVYYNYNEASGYDTKPTYVGILAQELQQISPYMISESTEKKAPDGSSYLQVDNSAMTYMLINAVKEQQQQIEALRITNAQLISRIETLEAKK